MATLGVFIALGTGGAYAANTIGSDDIIDGSIGSADVKDNSINTFDVHSFLGADVVDGTLTNADIQDFSLGNGDFLTGSVDTRVATDNSLAGTDIDESTLATVPSSVLGGLGRSGVRQTAKRGRGTATPRPAPTSTATSRRRSTWPVPLGSS